MRAQTESADRDWSYTADMVTDRSSRGVGRPRQFDPDDVLDQIIGLYQRNGENNTTLVDIEQETGVVRTSLYHHFGSKDELLAAVMQRYVYVVDQELIRPLAVGERGLEDITTALNLVAADLLEFGSSSSCLIFRSAKELASKSCTSQITSAYLASVRSAFRSALERSVQLGETDHDLVQQRSEILTGLVIGLHVQAGAGVGKECLEAALAAIHAEVHGWTMAEAAS